MKNAKRNTLEHLSKINSNPKATKHIAKGLKLTSFGKIENADGVKICEMILVKGDSWSAINPVWAANAEHICKAVNSFDDLVAALQGWVDYMDSDLTDGEKYLLKKAKSALQKAGIESLQKSSS